jgi:hypothetical protein
MESKKIKICKFLNCDKEVYTPQALFCGEHERTYRNTRKYIVAAIVPLSTAVLGSKIGGKLKK